MTKRMASTVLEKSIDLAVVIAGILIAISMNTCIENKAYKKDWEEHRVLFVKSIEKTKKDYEESFEKITEQVKFAEDALLDLKRPGTFDDTNLKKFVSSLGYLNLSAAGNEGIYHSFLTSKNPYFLKNFELMTDFDEFFAFKESMKVSADIYIQMSLPELFSYYRKNMQDGYDKTKIGKKELNFFITFQKGFLQGLAEQYKQQIEKSGKLLETLKN